MKQTIIIHGAPDEKEFYTSGFPSPSNAHWFPWLQKQLSLRNELCQALEYPRPFDPAYKEWLRVFNQLEIDEETTLIGHSCGGGFLLRYLSENPDIRVKQVFLIAPWLDPEKEVTTDFFDFELEPKLAERNTIHLFISSDDDAGILKSLEIIKQNIPGIIYHEFSDKEHFCSLEFPELLDLL